MDRAVWERVDKLEGWLLPDEAALLDKYNTGTWCEIGSWKGKSTYVLASKHPGYAIDHFRGSPEHGTVDTFDEFTRNIAPVKHNVTVIRRSCEDAIGEVTAPIDLLFIDGEHTYEATKRAFELYSPLVGKGGVVVLHDVWGYTGDKNASAYPEVTKFALELLEQGEWQHLADARRCLAVRR